MDQKMDHTEFANQIREAVQEALAQKENEGRLDKLESLLETAQADIQTLNTALAEKDELIAQTEEEKKELASQMEELASSKKENEDKLSDVEAALEAAKQRAEKAEAELSEIAADRALEVRMAELAEAKVARTSEDDLAKQKERVRGMSDEEFASYRDELVSLREEFASANPSPSEENNVPPANVEEARENAAGTEGLHVEAASTESLAEKYQKLGKKMADTLQAERDNR